MHLSKRLNPASKENLDNDIFLLLLTAMIFFFLSGKICAQEVETSSVSIEENTTLTEAEDPKQNTPRLIASNKCVDLVLELKIENLEINGQQFEWSKDDEILETTLEPTYRREVKEKSNLTGKYSVQVLVKDSTGELVQDPNVSLDPVDISSTPTLASDPMAKVDKVSSYLVLEVGSSDPNYTYSWEGPEEFRKSGEIVIREDLQFNHLGTYTLTATDTQSGCTTTKSVIASSEATPAPVFGTSSGIEETPYRQFTLETPLLESDILGNRKTSKLYDVIAKENAIITILGTLDGKSLIRFWNYNSPKVDTFNIVELQDTYRINGLRAIEMLNIENEKLQNSLMNLDESINLKNSNQAQRDSIKTRQIIKTVNDSIRMQTYKSSNRFTYNFTLSEENKGYIEKAPKYFLVENDLLEDRARKYWKKGSLQVTAGTIVLPVKLRFNDFQFSQDFSLGAFFGGQWRIHEHKPYFFNFGGTIAISSVLVTEANTHPDSERELGEGGFQNLAAFTLALGMVLEFDRVQLGVFTGWDWINNNRETLNSPGSVTGEQEFDFWNYQGKSWLSLGLGFSILSRPSGKEVKPSDQTNN